jgi:hypothetical protein
MHIEGFRGRPPPASTARTSSPKRLKSAVKTEGAMKIDGAARHRWGHAGIIFGHRFLSRRAGYGTGRFQAPIPENLNECRVAVSRR